MELRELVRLNSVAAQLIKHCSSPPLSEGPRGPMVSYCGTLTGFHSAPSQPIVSRRREHALDVLEREHGAGNVSHQILRFGPFSKVLPSPPTAFRHLRGAEASGPWPASPLYATLSERNKLLINGKLKRKVTQRNSSLYKFNHTSMKIASALPAVTARSFILPPRLRRLASSSPTARCTRDVSSTHYPAAALHRPPPLDPVEAQSAESKFSLRTDLRSLSAASSAPAHARSSARTAALTSAVGFLFADSFAALVRSVSDSLARRRAASPASRLTPPRSRRGAPSPSSRFAPTCTRSTPRPQRPPTRAAPPGPRRSRAARRRFTTAPLSSVTNNGQPSWCATDLLCARQTAARRLTGWRTTTSGTTYSSDLRRPCNLIVLLL